MSTMRGPAPHSSPADLRHFLGLCVGSLGVVFGDIGTSPLYAMKECFNGVHSVPATSANVLGVVSLIFWSLTLVISIKYLAYVMRADNRGEGGILALMAMADRGQRKTVRLGLVTALGLFGAALLYGDGMITPAISVLSAVEGVEIAAPHMQRYVVPVTIVILIGLFLFQRRGTAGVGAVFGPVMLLWFGVLAALGVMWIVREPAVLAALNPHHGFDFFVRNGGKGFLVLGAVFLCVTGGEALYADMGHFGVRPIRWTWFALAMPALVLHYFGQGAVLLRDPAAASHPFYSMAPSWALYPLVGLATLATVIASQAVITGAFSLTRQAAMLGYLPRTRIAHTSASEIGQIYVPAVNWLLMLATIGLVLGFGTSSGLAAAYGIAVTMTMVITTLLAFVVARRRWSWPLAAAVGLTLVFLVPDLGFLGANLAKIADGGWVPLAVGAVVFAAMATWNRGRAVLSERIRARTVPLDRFMKASANTPRVPGTAVFMTGNPDGTPPALVQNHQHNHVIHKTILLLTVRTEEVAWVKNEQRLQIDLLPNGFVRYRAHYGFMEDPDIPKLLQENPPPHYDPETTTYFLGRETVLAAGGMARWRVALFSFLARNAQRATAFFGIPAGRVMEIGADIEL
jgi:KUP system potassium uptake protein